MPRTALIPISALTLACSLLAGCAEQPSGGCPDRLSPAPLPTWARTGFRPPDQAMPYVLGDRGDIAAVVFGDPLLSPPGKDRGNKILWVSRVSQNGDPLLIEARLDGSGPPVTREVPGGPGPSGVDLPEAGCWHVTLRWSGHVDTLRLRYVQP
ncbi:hypothetical protein SAMN05421833_110186 [Microbispora rosea]|uniref:Lipoprotein n=1 Tax=Microbispora rosea TaxID=58117 RepID=A0A1N7BUB6_9ACTN|nr:hypothetical protein [Microbispora rosea]GIH52165.1 hypothetical protein Mro03_73440 [Microbispora rosea subsp. rosea]SIR54939.1 hypothetical protein SAMN05421833_110186 [Microbispora rosea]